EYLGKAERREHLVETVRAIKALHGGLRWDGGSYVPAMTGPLLPPPARPGGPPIWIGGVADAVVRLAAAEADAWNGWGMGAEGVTRKDRPPPEGGGGRTGPAALGGERRGRARRRRGRWPARPPARARRRARGLVGHDRVAPDPP